MTRFLGTETEYGISTPDQPDLSPITTSTHAVATYAAMRTAARFRWDYESESPLKDLRGFDLRRYHTVPIVDPDAFGVANMVTNNGGRFYVDHAHPEFSTPEVSNAWDGLRYDVAGDVIARRAIADVAQASSQGISVLKNVEPCPPLKMYKNNVDGKGASYGSHENYLFSRETDFSTMAKALIPFFCARQIITGAGRVGLGEEGTEQGFQISQRADYFFQEISLETTLNRGIINTRDEPHADSDKWRRLHVIIGDANLSHTAIFLKLGMTSLVMDAVEEGVDFSDLQLVDPLAALRSISRDLSLQHCVALRDGRQLSAIQILAEYRSRVTPTTEIDHKVIKLWDEVLDLLGEDPLATAGILDWSTKWSLIQSFLNRGLSLSDPKIKLIDLQYHDIDPERSLYQALVKKGKMRTLIDPSDIEDAADHAPSDSRAWLRGYVVSHWGKHVLAANWQSVIVYVADHPDAPQAKIHLDELDRGTEQELAQHVAGISTIEELLECLKAHGIKISYF
ncbi:proteasome accessory factor PafA2 [Corynebacterium poyangense]|uniref:Proteasome accessory factor PafA2 n=1 Tax=Corynebacterium poyangense TaxID=2684405 RepID=A0A7H0SNU6_9CORY|nr:depupylase/deamidase Dop [Corynebacterium poyangense]MBZ8177776.1 proteasome accessory factor PafA2 [Corynebacterium poyangense]QNQ90221.1 proteasome accessory factor PafA2 [Corynebacterium poyangense]